MSTAPPALSLSNCQLLDFWARRGYLALSPWPLSDQTLFPVGSNKIVAAELLPQRAVWLQDDRLLLTVVCRPPDLERERQILRASCRAAGLGEGRDASPLDLELAERRALVYSHGRLSDCGTWYGHQENTLFTTSERGRTGTRRQAQPVATLKGIFRLERAAEGAGASPDYLID